MTTADVHKNVSQILNNSRDSESGFLKIVICGINNAGEAVPIKLNDAVEIVIAT
jgi:hypothetical protein